MAVPSPVSIGPPSTSSVNPSTSVAKARAADAGASKRRLSSGDGKATANGSTVGAKVVVEVVVSSGAAGVVVVCSTGSVVVDERSEEHTSELQSLLRISYAVFCSNKRT